jgi:hypothetical protein
MIRAMPSKPPAPEKRRPGRPRTKERTRFPRSLQVYADDAVRDRIIAAAEARGISQSAWMEEAALAQLKREGK